MITLLAKAKCSARLGARSRNYRVDILEASVEQNAVIWVPCRHCLPLEFQMARDSRQAGVHVDICQNMYWYKYLCHHGLHGGFFLVPEMAAVLCSTQKTSMLDGNHPPCTHHVQSFHPSIWLMPNGYESKPCVPGVP